MHRFHIGAAALAVVVVVLAANLALAADPQDKEDKSTRVTATITLPKELASFTGRTLELRLYEYDPLLADVGADLVEKIEKAPFAHTQGEATELEIEIGAQGTIKPRRNYYLTVYVLEENRRTHIGEKDGQNGLCKVLTDGHPRRVTILVRSVR